MIIFIIRYQHCRAQSKPGQPGLSRQFSSLLAVSDLTMFLAIPLAISLAIALAISLAIPLTSLDGLHSVDCVGGIWLK